MTSRLLALVARAARSAQAVTRGRRAPNRNPAVPGWQQRRFGEWGGSEPDVTPGHHALPSTRTAAHVAGMARALAEALASGDMAHANSLGAYLGRGNFGEVYRVDTAQGPLAVKLPVAADWHGKPYPTARARRDFQHEAGNANQLARRGFHALVPESTYVELHDGTPAIVREYGEPVSAVTRDEFIAMERGLTELEREADWRVQDDLSVYRRPNGTLYIGDVGIWEPRPRGGGSLDRESSLGGLLERFARDAIPSLGKLKSLPSLERDAHFVRGAIARKSQFGAKVGLGALEKGIQSRRDARLPVPAGLDALVAQGRALLAGKPTAEEEEDILANPAPRRGAPPPAGQLSLLDRLTARAAVSAEAVAAPVSAAAEAPSVRAMETPAVLVASEPAPAPPAGTSSPTTPPREAPAVLVSSVPVLTQLKHRYVVEQGRKGWDVLDRATSTYVFGRDRLRATGDEARAERDRLEALFAAELAAGFPDLPPDRRGNALRNLAAAKILDPAAVKVALEGAPEPDLPPAVLPEGEVFAEGAVALPRKRRRGEIIAREVPPAETVDGEACATLSADEVPASETSAPMVRRFEVPLERFAAVEKNIAAWNRKAKKLQGFPLSIVVGEKVKKELDQPISYIDADGKRSVRYKPVTRYVVPVTITGEIPSLNGWVFVASLEPTVSGKENVVSAVGDIPVPLRFRTIVNTCNHCRTSRKRSETFVLYHEASRRFVQVGRSCLQDFLPGTDVQMVISLLEGLKTINEDPNEEGGGGGPPVAWGLMEYLPLPAMAIRLYGFRSSRQAEEGGGKSTAEVASEWWWALHGKNADAAKKVPQPTAGDEALAAEALAYYRDLAAGSDFDRNLQALARDGMMTSRHFGFVAFMLEGYLRAKGRVAEEAAQKAAQKPARHVGTVGERVELTVTLIRKIATESRFGTVVYGFTDAEGNALVWFGGPGKMEGNHTYRIVGTVEKHGEYRGTPQTQLARVSVLEDVSPFDLLEAESRGKRGISAEDEYALALLRASREGRLGPVRISRMAGSQYAAFVGEAVLVPYTWGESFIDQLVRVYPEALALVPPDETSRAHDKGRHVIWASGWRNDRAPDRAEFIARRLVLAADAGQLGGWARGKLAAGETYALEHGKGRGKQRVAAGDALEFVGKARAASPALAAAADAADVVRAGAIARAART